MMGAYVRLESDRRVLGCAWKAGELVGVGVRVSVPRMASIKG